MKRQAIVWATVGIAALAATGCATKKYVRTEMEATESRLSERVEGVESQVEQTQTQLADQDRQMGEISQTAQDALDRAVAAGKLAEGKFLYEVVLSEDKVRFEFDKADLSDEAKAALEEFAARLKQENANVFVEIQGHTDATGSESYNLKLGEQRAESVRRYLSGQQGLALHRMSIISYGESAPVADNGTREGRAQNRRVSLVVLK